MKRARETVRSYAEEARAQLAPLPDGLAAAGAGVALRLHRRPHQLTLDRRRLVRAGCSRSSAGSGRLQAGGRPVRGRVAAQQGARPTTIRPAAPSIGHRPADATRSGSPSPPPRAPKAERADAAARVHPGLGDRRGRGRRLRMQPDHREVQQPGPGPAESEAEHHAGHQRRRARHRQQREADRADGEHRGDHADVAAGPPVGQPAGERAARRRRSRRRARGSARPSPGSRPRAADASRRGTCPARSRSRPPAWPRTPITTSAAVAARRPRRRRPRASRRSACSAGTSGIAASASTAASTNAQRQPTVSATTGTDAPASSVRQRDRRPASRRTRSPAGRRGTCSASDALLAS